MKIFGNEKSILDYFRALPSNTIMCMGNYLLCKKIKLLVHSKLFEKSWIDSSAKNELPPDFHNEKFRIMMELMRVDDCVNEIDNKHIKNSFERTSVFINNNFGKEHKKRDEQALFFVPDTRNSTEFNFDGYVNNFKKVLEKHSKKLKNYHDNYKKCETVVFLICDESNSYVQVSNEYDLEDENISEYLFKVHYNYEDKVFLDMIKKCGADFVIWLGLYKNISIYGREIVFPKACVYDVKHIKQYGYEYDHSLMKKVK